MRVYLIHTTNPTSGADLWIVFDETRTIRRGKRRTAIDAWKREHGELKRITRFARVLRPSEAAMTIAEIQREVTP